MIKYTAAFVLSTGVLVYFIAPVSEEAQPKPVLETKAPEPSPPKTVEAEYWGDNAVNEDFTFGEPVKYNDSEYQIDDDQVYPNEEVIESTDRTASSNIPKKTVNTISTDAQNSLSKIIKTPKPGEPGSRENPINMLPS